MESKMKLVKLFLVMVTAITMFSGFWSGKSTMELREDRLTTSKETLGLVYKYAPDSKQMIANAYGYATFSNLGVNLILLSAEGGKGVAHNNQSGQNIYMNMASGGVGFGLGVKDFRIIFIFENKKVFDNFVTNGWEANAQADAAIKAGNEGGALNAAITVEPGVRIYKLTQNGLALQATIQGTKYWKDGDLN
jgi:lipid-binding SYLF domain-containing protein